MTYLSDVKNQYLYLFADCILSKGFSRTMLCDISRQKAYFIDNCFYDALIELKDKKIGDVTEMLDDAYSYGEFEIFINYLIDSELCELVDDLTLFPNINVEWDHPSPITNAIIDIRNVSHDFAKIFCQLDKLYCEHLQVRAYRVLSVEEIQNVVENATGKNFRSLMLITKFNGYPESINELYKLIKEYRFLRICLYGISERPELDPYDYYHDRIMYTNQDIQACDSCGIINKNSFTISTIQNFMENTLFNGCLNRKISIDESGNIKNCPSIVNSYGNISDVTLESVVLNDHFQRLWFINKDKISICSDCEYRRVCTDCRAYLKDPTNLYSKPAKCTYDPYSGTWENTHVTSTENFETGWL